MQPRLNSNPTFNTSIRLGEDNFENLNALISKLHKRFPDHKYKITRSSTIDQIVSDYFKGDGVQSNIDRLHKPVSTGDTQSTSITIRVETLDLLDNAVKRLSKINPKRIKRYNRSSLINYILTLTLEEHLKDE